jgi:hypothetical protein
MGLTLLPNAFAQDGRDFRYANLTQGNDKTLCEQIVYLDSGQISTLYRTAQYGNRQACSSSLFSLECFEARASLISVHIDVRAKGFLHGEPTD